MKGIGIRREKGIGTQTNKEKETEIYILRQTDKKTNRQTYK